MTEESRSVQEGTKRPVDPWVLEERRRRRKILNISYGIMSLVVLAVMVTIMVAPLGIPEDSWNITVTVRRAHHKSTFQQERTTLQMARLGWFIRHDPVRSWGMVISVLSLLFVLQRMFRHRRGSRRFFLVLHAMLGAGTITLLIFILSQTAEVRRIWGLSRADRPAGWTATSES